MKLEKLLIEQIINILQNWGKDSFYIIKSFFDYLCFIKKDVI